jgi:hypothetical protein
MLVIMKVVDIADEIYRELGSPSTESIAAIAFWIRGSVGTMNNHLCAEYVVNTNTYEIEQDTTMNSAGVAITILEAAVLKKMYEIHYYDKQLRTVLAAASTDSVIALSSDGSSIRKINKNEQAKLYLSSRNRLGDELKELIWNYKNRDVQPLQVAGDDDESSYVKPSREYIRIRKY